MSVFWRCPPPSAEDWLDELKAATEKDDVRILEHRLTTSNTSQFLLSTKPRVSPSAAIRSTKGRLQFLLRDGIPKCFQRNYSIDSVGSANATALDRYVADQAGHHPMADPRTQQILQTYQFHNPIVDLTHPRRSASGEFIHNLQLVLVHQERLTDVREEYLRNTNETVRQIADKNRHLLSRLGMAADHLHLTLGCDVAESPEDVALSYLNNLAYRQGMKPIFQFGFYVGTFGLYDLQAIRNSLASREPISRASGGASPSESEEVKKGTI